MDTACSSSLVATHLAHRGLLDGETSAALAAGVNLILAPDTSRHMAQLGALSPTGRSKSLDAAADGYGRGEGCVCLAMRRSGERSDAAYTPLAILQGDIPIIFARHLMSWGREDVSLQLLLLPACSCRGSQQSTARMLPHVC